MQVVHLVNTSVSRAALLLMTAIMVNALVSSSIAIIVDCKNSALIECKDIRRRDK